MKLKVIVISLVVLITLSCEYAKSWGAERLYFKRIQASSIKIDWFHYSHITSISPDYVLIQKGQVIDTICFADRVDDVNITIDDSVTIKLLFSSTPTRYGKKIEIKDNYLGYKVTVDTTGTKNRPMKREYFKVDED